jgi:8-oxo-dGTP pyrophosphatase MutT (NUDIX family)
MKKPWHLLGRIVYWISWPALFIYLRFTKRTRVLIVCNEEVLLTKSWMGSGAWHLPGGGLHSGEEPIKGAIREINEELGLNLTAEQLKLLLEKRHTNERHLSFVYYGYVVTLTEKPQLKKPSGEISELAWFKISEIKDLNLGGATVKDMLDTWGSSPESW